MCAETESPNQTGGRTVTMATQSLATAAESSAGWKACGIVRERREGRPVIRGHALIQGHAEIRSFTQIRQANNNVTPLALTLATRTVSLSNVAMTVSMREWKSANLPTQTPATHNA